MMMMLLRFCLCFSLLFSLLSCQSAPPLGYAESAPVVQKRELLSGTLLQLLPEAERRRPEAQAEARWLADTAYKASASIARLNKSCLAGWLNNRLVNSRLNLQERGLCWHYTHDLYRELRRRQLEFFRLGSCVRDRGKGSEHHAVFVVAREGHWPCAVILDAWRYNGRLKIIEQEEVVEDEWEEDVPRTDSLARIYTECHSYPIEHWARVKSGRKWNDYVYSWTPEGTSSRQGIIMQQNIQRGLKERGGKLYDY